MIRPVRDAFGGGSSRELVDAVIERGMADVLAALDHVIDDDAALAHIYVGLGENEPADLGRWARTAADEIDAPIGAAGSATVRTNRASVPAGSRWRLALRLAAGVTAAALTAGAVALRAIGGPGASHNSTEAPTDPAAYVIGQVSSALSAADRGEIAQVKVTTRGTGRAGRTAATTTSEEWSYGDEWRSVTNSPAGHPVYGEGSSTASLYTLVSYLTRTWARQPGLGRPAAPISGPRGCKPVVAALPLLFQPGLPGRGLTAGSLLTVARDLRAAVSCGTLTVAGEQRADGTEAIELTSRPASMITETIWVSRGTYLPVRVVIRPVPSKPEFLTADVTWLPPTARNLAKLTVPIPARFREVPLAAAVTPVPHLIRG